MTHLKYTYSYYESYFSPIHYDLRHLRSHYIDIYKSEDIKFRQLTLKYSHRWPFQVYIRDLSICNARLIQLKV
jgi:hypothetical protein